MATEVENERYSHGAEERLPTRRPAPGTGHAGLKRLAETRRCGTLAAAGGGAAQPRREPRIVLHKNVVRAKHERQPFYHNPLHDLESMFWVTAWILVCSTFVKTSEGDSETPDEEWEERIRYHAVFGDTLFGWPNKRNLVMISAGSWAWLDGIVGLLDPVYQIAKWLNGFRCHLIDEYVAAGIRRRDPTQEISFSTMASHELYAHLMKLLVDCAADLREKNLDLAIDVGTCHEESLEIQENTMQASE